MLFLEFDTILFRDHCIEVLLDGKHGLVNPSLLEDDPKGKEIIKYDDLVNVKGCLFLCKKDNKWGFSNQEPPFEFDDIEYLDNEGNSFLFTIKKANRWAFYRGENSKDLIYYDTKPKRISEDCYYIKNIGKVGVVTSKNVVVVPFEYDDLKQLGNNKDYALMRNGKWALGKKQDGTMNVSDFDYDEIRSGANSFGLYAMRVDDKWGFVSWRHEDGKEKVFIINPKYDTVNGFIYKDGGWKALVKKGNKEYYIDKDGKKVK